MGRVRKLPLECTLANQLRNATKDFFCSTYKRIFSVLLEFYVYGSSAFVVGVIYLFPFGYYLFVMTLLAIYQWLEQS